MSSQPLCQINAGLLSKPCLKNISAIYSSTLSSLVRQYKKYSAFIIVINITIHLPQLQISTALALLWHYQDNSAVADSSHIIRERICTKNLQFKQTRRRREDLNPRFIAGDLMHREKPIPPCHRKPMGTPV